MLFHFCPSERRDETDLNLDSAPWHFRLEWQQPLIFLRVDKSVGKRNVSPSLGGHGSLCFSFFVLYVAYHIYTSRHQSC